VRLTIGTKLVGLIAILLISSVAGIVFLSSRMVVEENTALIQQINSDTATGLATQMREQFENLTEKMRVLGTMLNQEGQAADLKEQIIGEFFSKDKDFLAMLVQKRVDGSTDFTLGAKALSPDFLKSLATAEDPRADKAAMNLLSAKEIAFTDLAIRGGVQLAATSLPDGGSAIAISIPFIESPVPGEIKYSHLATALIRQDRFVKAFGESGIVTSFMVDAKGKLIAHPDAGRVAAGENVAHLEIVKQLLEGKFNNGQTTYLDPASKEKKLGAFRVVGFGGLGVVAEVPEAKAFEVPRRLEYRSSLIGLIILCFSFFVGYVFSGTLSKPIKLLADAALRIAQGDFKIRLKTKGRDEVAQLSQTFNEMAAGLEERDRVKATFAKFHSKEMAEKVLNGELKLGGERKQGTVFFSDVRGFTAMSEGMDPEALVSILNRYMTRMVRVILEHGGVVDKYVGDAIMALWGIPLAKEGDVEQAMRACLGMRQALAELNEELKAEGLPLLKIGMGLNYGTMISGNIGSDERMEFTVIGDTVNTASRIESLTKEFGTDFLISKEVLEQVQGKFVVEKAHEAKVKGKAEPLAVYKVHGFVNEQGQQVLIQTAYSSYAAEKSDKVVHDDKSKAALPAPAHEAPPTPVVHVSSEVALVTSPAQEAVQVHVEPPALEPTPVQEVSMAQPEQPVSVTSVAVLELAPVQAPEPVTAEQPPVAPVAEATTFIEAKPAQEPGANALFNRKSWFLNMSGDVLGPFTRMEIASALQKAEITAEQMISDTPDGPWVPLSQRPELKTLLGTAAKKAA
jgi:adenylate cyclase